MEGDYALGEYNSTQYGEMYIEADKAWAKHSKPGI